VKIGYKWWLLWQKGEPNSYHHLHRMFVSHNRFLQSFHQDHWRASRVHQLCVRQCCCRFTLQLPHRITLWPFMCSQNRRVTTISENLFLYHHSLFQTINKPIPMLAYLYIAPVFHPAWSSGDSLLGYQKVTTWIPLSMYQSTYFFKWFCLAPRHPSKTTVTPGFMYESKLLFFLPLTLVCRLQMYDLVETVEVGIPQAN
jgi:hypothetical protein